MQSSKGVFRLHSEVGSFIRMGEGETGQHVVATGILLLKTCISKSPFFNIEGLEVFQKSLWVSSPRLRFVLDTSQIPRGIPLGWGILSPVTL